MKRGSEEKVMGPMFPRLHVNDADKGGPRAPPRNKMALYEQLSIPSQRFNPGVLPLNSKNQVSRAEGNLPFPFHARQSDGANGANETIPLEQPEQRKVGDEDDFRVPVLVQSMVGLGHSKTQIGSDKEKLTPINPPHSDHFVKVKSVGKKDPKQISSSTLNLQRELRSDREEDLMKVSGSGRDHSEKSATELSTRQKIDGPVDVNASPNQESAECSVLRFKRLAKSDACLQQGSRSGSQPNATGQGDGFVESSRDVEKGTVSQERSVSCSEADPNSPNEPDIDSKYRGDRTCISPQMGHVDKSDDVSETSMVDSISGMDISPDDVVGIIGQKHFWKARKAIVNQQRLFAVQVFELHRLIKVQRLIAGSPHLLLEVEDTAFLGTPTLRGSPAKKLSSEYVVKPLLHVVKRKHEPEKPYNKMECSAENAVGKTSLSSVRNGSQTPNYGPYLGNPQPAPVASDNKASPWCFHQSPGHQLLIPVMLPSEGLVYKPYNGPGFMGGPICGGCGPFNSTPMTGNFVKPTYGVLSSHHQGMGVLPVPPSLGGHTCFPPYVMNPAMPSSAVEQMHWFPGPGSHGHTDQLSGGGTNSNLQHQSSCNMPSQKNVTIPHAKRFQPSNDSGLQGSTANSTGDRARVGTDQNPEGNDALQLFPIAPVIPDGVPQSHDTGQPMRAIKVVPHNPRTATASAARIFQSIQAERKQQDST